MLIVALCFFSSLAMRANTHTSSSILAALSVSKAWLDLNPLPQEVVSICLFQTTLLARLLTSAPIASANLPPRFRELPRAFAETVSLPRTSATLPPLRDHALISRERAQGQPRARLECAGDRSPGSHRAGQWRRLLRPRVFRVVRSLLEG